MSSDSQSYIKQANALFCQERYNEAIDFYTRAGKKIGMHLVEANIWLCSKRSGESTSIPKIALQAANAELTQPAEEAASYAQQLEVTQSLLEKYYMEAQSLKFQLMDMK